MPIFKDKIGTSGHVRVFLNGNLHWEGSNIVTSAGLNYMAKLVSGMAAIISPASNPTLAYEAVDTIRIGNGGSLNLVSDPTIPLPPARGDTALSAEIIPSTLAPSGVYEQNIFAVVSGNTSTLTASFQADDLIDADFPLTDGAVVPQTLFVNEAGLYVNAPETAVQVLFARVTFPSLALPPTSGYTLTIEWIIGHL